MIYRQLLDTTTILSDTGDIYYETSWCRWFDKKSKSWIRI